MLTERLPHAGPTLSPSARTRLLGLQQMFTRHTAVTVHTNTFVPASEVLILTFGHQPLHTCNPSARAYLSSLLQSFSCSKTRTVCTVRLRPNLSSCPCMCDLTADWVADGEPTCGVKGAKQSSARLGSISTCDRNETSAYNSNEARNRNHEPYRDQ